MDGHLVHASSNSNIRCSLENFTLDPERWLAALYWCVRTELTRITAAAIAVFVSNHLQAVEVVMDQCGVKMDFSISA
jgi:hypothetical protein